MELLVFGIDGGDLEIMKTFDMPYFHNLLSNNKSILLEEDLFNRGWAEILTGQEGKETHGFYMAPKLDGTHKFATSFKMKDLEGIDAVKPIWTMLEEKGVSYCIMNVPTTTPVPKTKNGIVIGSAGGGLNKIEGIPEMLVSDEKTRKYLEDHEYIVDIRIPNHEISSTEVLFEQLVQMEKVRTKCFVDICNANDSSLGFLVDRGTTIVQYLARNEIEKYSTDKSKMEPWIRTALEKHYQQLDENIKLMVERLNPKNIIITADHNTVPHIYRGSVAPFLIENNWLVKQKKFSVVKTIKTSLKKLGILSFASKMKKNIPTLSKTEFSGYNMKRSVAFGSNYIAGIYINDNRRFGGPINGESDQKKLISEIIEKFNSVPAELRANMIAKPYRSLLHDGRFSDALPDIFLTNSEGIFFDDEGSSIVWKNKNYNHSIPKDLSLVRHAAFTGDKGKNPIMVTSPDIAALKKSQENNLTVVYKLVKRYFESHVN